MVRGLYSGDHIIMLLLLITEGKPKYALENGKYIITGHNLERVYDPRFMTIFPRMWSDQSDHEEVYKAMGKSEGNTYPGHRSEREKRRLSESRH